MTHTIHEPRSPFTAVVFDSPHSGTTLPAHFNFVCGLDDLKYYHDPHIDRLLADIPETGAPVLEANIHRTCIDLNRFETEIDPSTILGGWPYPTKATKYTDLNVGLLPVMTGPVWNRTKPIYDEAHPLTADEAHLRLRAYYRPYYTTLKTLMNRASDVHEQCLLVDTHSLFRTPGSEDIILGDMNGTTCSPVITQIAASVFRQHGLSVAFNRPSGHAIIKTTADFSKGHHSLQVEIARDLYMDMDTYTYDEKKAARIKSVLHILSTKLAKLMVA